MNLQDEISDPVELDPREVRAVKELKDGKVEGLEYLVKKYELRAVRCAILITCDRGLAEDVVQDTFIRAFKRIRTFQPNQPFGPWFLRSVTNAAMRETKKRNRVLPWSDHQIEERMDLGRRRFPLPEDVLERSETNQEVWRAIESLSPKMRAALVLRYFEGFSLKDLSRTTNSKVGTVKWRLSQARKQVKGILALNRELAIQNQKHREGK